MNHGFQNKLPLLTRSGDGRNCIVLEPLYFTDKYDTQYRTPIGLKTDGGSVPPLGLIGGLVSMLAFLLCQFNGWFAVLGAVGAIVSIASYHLNFYGRWWWSYIFHDSLFQGNTEKWSHHDQKWLPYMPSEAKANTLLFESMKTQHANRLEALIVWVNLHWFGWKAFREDRAAH